MLPAAEERLRDEETIKSVQISNCATERSLQATNDKMEG